MYNEYKPHPLLSPYIAAYWVSEGYVPVETFHKILPDGCVDIVFSFNDYSPLIVGTMTTSFEITYTGKVSMMGIRFKPAGITAFTKVPVNSFTNSHTDISLVETIFDNYFYDILSNMTTSVMRIEYLNGYFCKKLSSVYELDKQIVYAVGMIQLFNGNIPVAELARKSCLSQRHFERRFKFSVGIPPKSFSRIIKFRKAHELLILRPINTLLDVAVDCGYYDHSHLIKEIKHFSGDLVAGLHSR